MTLTSFFRSQKQLDEFCEKLYELYDTEQVFESDNSLTFHVDFRGNILEVQAINKVFFKKPADVIENFDFTNCQLITNGDSMIVGDSTLDDIDARVLRPNLKGLKSGQACLRRICKFGAEGYKLGAGEAVNLITYLKNHPVVCDNIEGISDTAIPEAPMSFV